MPQDMQSFSPYVQLVFNNWTALELTVSHSMGGPNSYANALSIMTEVIEVFEGPMKDTMDIDSLTDFLYHAIDDRLSTICQDESPEEVAGTLFHLYKCFASGNAVMLEQALKSLRHDKCWLAYPRTIEYQVPCPVEVVEQTSPEEVEKMEEDKSEGEPPEDNDWTTVNSKKKKTL